MRSMKSIARFGGLCAVLFAHGALSQAQEYTTLVATAWNDTVAVDRFARDETTLEGVLLVRSPRTHTLHYRAMLAPDGRFSLLEMVWRDAEGTELSTGRIAFGVDSIRSKLADPVEQSFSALPTLDAIPLPPRPYAHQAYAMFEHAVLIMMMADRPGDVELQWILAGAQKAVDGRGRRLSGDTLEIGFVDGPWRARVGENGRLLWLSGEIDGKPIVVRRSDADVDLQALTASFARRDTSATRRDSGGLRRY